MTTGSARTSLLRWAWAHVLIPLIVDEYIKTAVFPESSLIRKLFYTNTLRNRAVSQSLHDQKFFCWVLLQGSSPWTEHIWEGIAKRVLVRFSGLTFSCEHRKRKIAFCRLTQLSRVTNVMSSCDWRAFSHHIICQCLVCLDGLIWSAFERDSGLKGFGRVTRSTKVCLPILLTVGGYCRPTGFSYLFSTFLSQTFNLKRIESQQRSLSKRAGSVYQWEESGRKWRLANAIPDRDLTKQAMCTFPWKMTNISEIAFYQASKVAGGALIQRVDLLRYIKNFVFSYPQISFAIEY